ncbi:uncharacterized protein B0H18DRAFT_1210797 [Fomitopsis serialis]|uniref:uncharacterized protein n=1 Tax=Fomitopsis serialis TaxID=139415 RepID=UPI002007B303|nr:uncharacterized protein B0H18DRAFT_1210797 [Neoantrodia serialis]KAH9926880.1 hypothetical protein B0H18DRAFT_1210797 [Neoantrodia serialis]
MTWVLGWPLYYYDAIEIAKTHNLVKDPNANDVAYAEAAQEWIADRVGLIPVFSCWVDDLPQLVYAAYVDYGDSPNPPAELNLEEKMTDKQYRRLKGAMPLKDFGWYQHNDPSGVLYEETVYDSDGDSGEDSDGDSDAGSEGTARSDNETVTDGVVLKSDMFSEDSSSSETAQSLLTEFDAHCTVVDSQP